MTRLLPCLALLFLVSPVGRAQPVDTRPNVLVFLVDDLGWQDSSVPMAGEPVTNNRWFRTPHLEALAQRGVTFTQAYASSPVCSPTRVAIMTGQHPARLRITNWIGAPGGQAKRNPEHEPLLVPRWNGRGLDGSEATLPRLLREAGYRCGHIGKAHFGRRGTKTADPLHVGFEFNIAGHAAGHPASYYAKHGYRPKKKPKSPWAVPDLEEFHGSDTYLTDALTIHAERFLRAGPEGKRRPFFLHLSHYAVHTPIQADPGRLGPYAERGRKKVEAAYASMVAGVDDSLGRVIETLREIGELDRTIVCFLSDNGGLTAVGGPPTTNAPLRGGKGSWWEGGTRIPMIWSGPGIARGARTQVPVVAHDLWPTLLAACGVTPRTEGPRDGRDLGAVLAKPDTAQPPRDLFWHYPHYWAWPAIRKGDHGVGPFTSMRRGRWKLVFTWEDRRCALYDLEADLGERQDLAAARPKITRELAGAMGRWMQEVGAQPPRVRPTGADAALPR